MIPCTACTLPPMVGGRGGGKMSTCKCSGDDSTFLLKSKNNKSVQNKMGGERSGSNINKKKTTGGMKQSNSVVKVVDLSSYNTRGGSTANTLKKKKIKTVGGNTKVKVVKRK